MDKRNAFNDASGDVWELRLNYLTAARVQEQVGIDLLQSTRGRFEVLEELGRDPWKLIGTLFALCESQAAQRDVSESDFAARLNPDVLDEAATALIHAIIAFLPKASRPSLERTLAKITAKTQDHNQECERIAAAFIDSDEFDRKLDAMLDEAFGSTGAAEPVAEPAADAA